MQEENKDSCVFAVVAGVISLAVVRNWNKPFLTRSYRIPQVLHGPLLLSLAVEFKLKAAFGTLFPSHKVPSQKSPSWLALKGLADQLEGKKKKRITKHGATENQGQVINLVEIEFAILMNST